MERRGPGALGALSIAAFVLSVGALVVSLVVPPLIVGEAEIDLAGTKLDAACVALKTGALVRA